MLAAAGDARGTLFEVFARSLPRAATAAGDLPTCVTHRHRQLERRGEQTSCCAPRGTHSRGLLTAVLPNGSIQFQVRTLEEEEEIPPFRCERDTVSSRRIRCSRESRSPRELSGFECGAPLEKRLCESIRALETAMLSCSIRLSNPQMRLTSFANISPLQILMSASRQ